MYCTPFFSLAVTGRIQNPNLAVFVAEELATLAFTADNKVDRKSATPKAIIK